MKIICRGGPTEQAVAVNVEYFTQAKISKVS